MAIIAYTSDAIYLIPAFIGAWIGTYTVVKIKRTKMLKKQESEKNARCQNE
jgi:uncharacterized membrane protein YfcA